jgi:predicted  nucleic acid-binding Zn-ribbon protein
MNDINEKQLKAELDKYKRQYRNLAERCKQLEGQLSAAESQTDVLRVSLSSAQKAVDINKTMLRQSVEEHSRKERELIEYMNLLKAKLRDLGYADFNKLGNEGN